MKDVSDTGGGGGEDAEKSEAKRLAVFSHRELDRMAGERLRGEEEGRGG